MSDAERPEDREPEEDRGIPDVGARFRMVRCLGSGGMGDVWLAEDLELHRPVAVKTVRASLTQNEEIRKRIERECLLHAKVGPHPHIVTLFDKVEREGRIHLIMEYVDGESLQRALERNGDGKDPLAVSMEEAVEIAGQCLAALSRIHAAGIIHRDIKPANIMLSREGSGVCAKLMDFGIARLEDSSEALTRLTTTHGSSPGTPMYMAPEQIDSKTFGEVSYATDVYAVGILLYQMLSGEPPFTGTLTEVLNGHVNRAVPRINLRSGGSVPGSFLEVLERALSKRPEQRFPSAEAFRKALAASPSGDAVTTTRVIDAARLQRVLEGGEAQPESEPPQVAGESAGTADDAGTAEDSGTEGTGPSTGRKDERSRRMPVTLGVAIVVVLVGAAAVLLARGRGGGIDTPKEDVQPSEPIAQEMSDATVADVPAGKMEADGRRVEGASAAHIEDEALETAEVSALVAPKEALALPDADVAFDADEAQENSPEDITPIDVLELSEPPAESANDVADMASPSEEARALDEAPMADGPSVEVKTPAAEKGDDADATEPAASAADTVSETPDAAGAKRTYVVQPGDSLSRIADRFNVDVVDLARWNLLSRPDQLAVGATLYLYERPNLPEVEPTFDAPKRQGETAESGQESEAPSRAGTPYRRTAEDLFVAPTPAEQVE